jgi:hypothetical protein
MAAQRLTWHAARHQRLRGHLRDSVRARHRIAAPFVRVCLGFAGASFGLNSLRTSSSAASGQDIHDKEGDDDDGRRDSDDRDGGDG